MDEYRNGNLDNEENIESENTNGYATDDSNTQKSGAKDAREPFGEEENNGSEEESSCFEGQNDSEKAETGEIFDSEKTDENNDEVSSAGYVWNSGEGSTYHFKPENMKEYVGTRTYEYKSSSEAAEDEPKDKKEKKRKKKKKNRKPRSPKAYLFWLVPLLVVSSLLMGIAGGLIVMGSIVRVEVTQPDPVETTKVEMNKNEAPVEVEVIVDNTSAEALSVAQVAELVADAVVEISTSAVVENSFFGSYTVSHAGSGVVIAQTDEYAYVVTNYHVIEGASEVVVTSTDGSDYEAEYLDGDAAMDIAMIRIKPDKEFPKLVCGSSSAMKVGEEVVAIGNPLGQFGGTVTNGIISALERRVDVGGNTMVLMQTNAAVNNGNSGGGLFNMAGELVGIVNAKIVTSGDSETVVEGIGFAIPIDRIYDTLVEIIENKYIHGRPTLDIEVNYVSSVWEAMKKYGIQNTGIFVTNSNYDEIEVDDYIVSINSELVYDGTSYAAAVSDLEVGETVTVELYRSSDDGRWYKKTVEVEVNEYVPSGIFG